MSTSSRSMLAHAIHKETVELMRVNEVKFMSFVRPQRGRRTMLGVQGLSACSVVALVSDYAATVAHIGPNLSGFQSTDSYLLAGDQMAELEETRRAKRHCFGSDSHSYLIFAGFGNVVSTPEQVHIMRARLYAMGVPVVAERSYGLSPSEMINEEGAEGTVLVQKLEHRAPTVFLEDEAIRPARVSVAGHRRALLHQ